MFLIFWLFACALENFPAWPSEFHRVPNVRKKKVKRTKCNLLWNTSCNSAPAITTHKSTNMSCISSLQAFGLVFWMFFPLSWAHLQLQFLELCTICITLLVQPQVNIAVKKRGQTSSSSRQRRQYRMSKADWSFSNLSTPFQVWTWHPKALVSALPNTKVPTGPCCSRPVLFVLWGNGKDLYHLLL